MVKRMVKKIIAGTSLYIQLFFTSKTVIIEAKPRINPILAMLDPIIFPIDIPMVFFNAAVRLTTNSGKEVPIETTLNPIMTGLIIIDK